MLATLSSEELEELSDKDTPKSIAVVWRSDSGEAVPEAGNFVEVQGGGGIIGLNDLCEAGESGELAFSCKRS